MLMQEVSVSFRRPSVYSTITTTVSNRFVKTQYTIFMRFPKNLAERIYSIACLLVWGGALMLNWYTLANIVAFVCLSEQFWSAFKSTGD
jgi:hypothetical protein